jgi:hypothetical protein
MSLCLTAGAFALSLAGQALHLYWTGTDGVARAESWIVQDRRMVLSAARVKGGTMPAGAEGALRIGDWWHYWPQQPPQDRVTFGNAPGANYRLCWDTGCADLDYLLPRNSGGVPVAVASCFPPG